MRVVSQAAMRPHVLQFPSLMLAARFRLVAERMLNWAGAGWNSPSLDRARAIVGWFAANAVHPQAFLHPDGTTLNTGVLPSGETWATFNALFNQASIIDRDQNFWYALFPNGIAMLEQLIGTVDANGVVADNGMLTEYSPGQWRIRNFTDFRAPQCTLQCKMAQVILAAIGIPAIDISTVGHDPMMVYDIDSGRWLYIDPTFGEMLKVGSNYLSPLDALETCLQGNDASISGEKLPEAGYIPVGYFTSPNYPVGGMNLMTVHTAPQWAGGLSNRASYRFGNLPSQSSSNDRPGTVDELMPQLGVGVAGLRQSGQTVEIRLRSNWPEHTAFQSSTDGGVTWVSCDAIDYRPYNYGEVRYRSIDAEPRPGMSAIVNI